MSQSTPHKPIEDLLTFSYHTQRCIYPTYWGIFPHFEITKFTLAFKAIIFGLALKTIIFSLTFRAIIFSLAFRAIIFCLGVQSHCFQF